MSSAPTAATTRCAPSCSASGHAYLSSTPLVVSAQPFLDQVSDAVSESCSLATLEGEDILYVARSITSRIISVTLNVGSRLPAYCTSIGQVLLAHLSPEALEQYFSSVALRPFTERTVTDQQQAARAARAGARARTTPSPTS